MNYIFDGKQIRLLSSQNSEKDGHTNEQFSLQSKYIELSCSVTNTSAKEGNEGIMQFGVKAYMLV